MGERKGRWESWELIKSILWEKFEKWEDVSQDKGDSGGNEDIRISTNECEKQPQGYWCGNLCKNDKIWQTWHLI